MYAIACKFPDQKRFQTMDIYKGEQVGNWMYCTLFKTLEKAKEIVNQIQPMLQDGVELKVIKYKTTNK